MSELFFLVILFTLTIVVILSFILTGFLKLSVCDKYIDPGPGRLFPSISEIVLATRNPCAIRSPKIVSLAKFSSK